MANSVMKLTIQTERSSIYYPTEKPIIVNASVDVDVDIAIDPDTQKVIIAISNAAGSATSDYLPLTGGKLAGPGNFGVAGSFTVGPGNTNSDTYLYVAPNGTVANINSLGAVNVTAATAVNVTANNFNTTATQAITTTSASLDITTSAATTLQADAVTINFDNSFNLLGGLGGIVLTATSSVLSGPFTADTQAANDNSTLIATTAFVHNLLANVAQGLDTKDSVRLIATANINIAAPNITVIDGTTLALNDRIALAGQNSGAENGIYNWHGSASPLTRTLDANSNTLVTSGLFFWVTEGTANSDTGWILITHDPITLGSTPLDFTQFGGSATILSGTGLTKSGNTLSVDFSLVAALISPSFTGNPTATTQATADNSTRLATTAYVQNNLTPYALLVSPNFTGNATATTQATADSTNKIATTAFVQANLAAFATNAFAGYALLASPAFTGLPSAPTPSTADNTTKIATTAYVQNNLSGFATNAAVTNALSGYALLNSPTLIGDPTAPTQTVGNDSTRIASTAFVNAAIGAATIGFSQLPTEVKNTIISAFFDVPQALHPVNICITQAMTLPANFAGTISYSGTLATASTTFSIGYIRSGVPTAIGTIIFTNASRTGTLSTQAALTLAIGDILTITQPSSIDATLAGVAIAIVLTKI